MSARSTDDNPIKITREIPAVWLFTMIAAIVGWGISNYVSFQELQKMTQQNIEEVKKISAQMNAQEIKTAQSDARMGELERRINNHDGRITELERRPR